MKAYKATRPDGTDFQTGTINYSILGSTVRHPDKGKRIANQAETYLSVSVEPGETLIGGSWPCRLFEVEISSSALRDLDASPYKRAVKSLKVISEIEAWRALGPNGDKVVATIARIESLTTEQINNLAAARAAAWAAARAAAWDAAAWAAARDAARGAAWRAARDAAAWDAARDAALALTVFDLLTEDQFVALAGPWIDVIGDPR